MSLKCGISFEWSGNTWAFPSLAIQKVVPRNTTDAVSVISDNQRMKRGRIAGANIDSPLSYNRQVELDINLTNADLASLRRLRNFAGAEPMVADISRIDLFSDGNFDTPQTVVLLNLKQVKRTKAGYCTAKLELVKV